MVRVAARRRRRQCQPVRKPGVWFIYFDVSVFYFFFYSEPLLLLGHQMPSLRPSNRVVRLFAGLGTPAFCAWHAVLEPLAAAGRIAYVSFHQTSFASDASSPALLVSGYGVELAIKNTEYRLFDDSEDAAGGETPPADAASLEEDGMAPLPLTVEPIPKGHMDGTAQTCGSSPSSDYVFSSSSSSPALEYKVASHILSSANPLATMRHVSQNLPSVAPSIARDVRFDRDLMRTLGWNRQRQPYSPTSLLINGLSVETSSIETLTTHSCDDV